jgi:hypothetical protein
MATLKFCNRWILLKKLRMGPVGPLLRGHSTLPEVAIVDPGSI